MQTRRAVLLNDEAVAGFLLDFTGGLGSLIELSFPFVLFKAHEKYNTGMGRLRIKKKETVIPFRETLAYRSLLLIASITVFLVALYIAIGALRANNTVSSVVSAAVGVAAAFAIFYNFGRMSSARVSQRTLKRMKRR